MLSLFRITVVLFLAIVSVVFLALVFTAVVSMFGSSPLLAESNGIGAVAGGVSAKLFGFSVIAAVVLVAGGYVFWSRRKLRSSAKLR